VNSFSNWLDKTEESKRWFDEQSFAMGTLEGVNLEAWWENCRGTDKVPDLNVEKISVVQLKSDRVVNKLSTAWRQGTCAPFNIQATLALKPHKY